MFIAAHEWSRPLSHPLSGVGPALESMPDNGATTALYGRLIGGAADLATQTVAADFLRQQIALAADEACDLPQSPDEVEGWMNAGAQLATAKYSAYLAARKAGAQRSYFSNRAHALYFLHAVAPTKLVDGAWLYGLAAHWRNPRFADLIKTYVEELGEGDASKNHVLLYRQLLAHYGLGLPRDLDGRFFVQGATQLALSCNAAAFLPEIIGFNLAYEQLPLHLLITAYELNELGIDPYYFTLHVTVDNAESGHARRAVQSVHNLLPGLSGRSEFWWRMRQGAKLSNAGVGTLAVIEGFDIGQEVIRIFSRKSAAGHGAHSNYCRFAGRSVNDWLSQPDQVPDFLAALGQAGWIRRGEPVGASRFWKLLQGERAEMFGVFTTYELQVIHDWIRGDASADGRAYGEPASVDAARCASFRASVRNASRPPPVSDEIFDPDLDALKARLAESGLSQQTDLLIQAMAPSQHWTPAGLYATRLFQHRYA